MATLNGSAKTPEEVTLLGVAILRDRIENSLQFADKGKFVAIDVDSGEYEIDTNDIAAFTRLLTRLPQADVWLGRVGDDATYRIARNSQYVQ